MSAGTGTRGSSIVGLGLDSCEDTVPLPSFMTNGGRNRRSTECRKKTECRSS
uniref:Uncharacterized protein n=1 Tax=Daucus carota subsp. sativus TaxID=79200 RepID=A0A166HED7_DAUCS